MKIKILFAFVLSFACGALLRAQDKTYSLERLPVNEQVTTVITATEPVRFVDISTDKVAGDQPLSNTVRLKPKAGPEINVEGDILAVVTIITERYRVQYALVYTPRMREAITEKTIEHSETTPYNNPAVSMSTEEMSRFAWKIWNSPTRYRNVGARKHHMGIRLNNIYSAGEYFFIKRQTRAANSQSIELTPAFMLHNPTGFLHGYRNVLVLRKLTFPNDKVLSIVVSEKQVSGRTITLSIDYEDVLYADSFSKTLLVED